MARSPRRQIEPVEAGQRGHDLPERRTPVGQDRHAHRAATGGQAGAHGTVIQLVDGERGEPAPLEPPEEAARRRQRDADPRGDLADPGPVVTLAEHEKGTPLGERELEAGVRLGERARGEADGAHGDPLQVGRDRVHGGEMPGRGARRRFVDGHPVRDDRPNTCQVAIIRA